MKINENIKISLSILLKLSFTISIFSSLNPYLLNISSIFSSSIELFKNTSSIIFSSCSGCSFVISEITLLVYKYKLSL